MANLTFSLSFRFVHYFTFLGTWGTAWWSWHEVSSLFSKHVTAHRVYTLFPCLLSQENRKKEKKRKKTGTQKAKWPSSFPPRYHWAKPRGKATGVAIRGHAAAVASAQPSKPLPGLSSASCFPAEAVRCLRAAGSAEGWPLSFQIFVCLLASCSCLSTLQSFFRLLLSETFKARNTDALKISICPQF